MDQGLIPRRYAKALYDTALSRNEASALYGAMQTLAAAFVSEPTMGPTMANPFVTDADKERLVLAAVPEAKDIPLMADFLTLLCRNRRLDMVRAIANAYIDLYRQCNDIYKVTVQSAAPLEPEVRQRITDLIQNHIGKGTLEINFEVDPKLIGGFKVRLGNELLDASVATRLNDIRLGLIR